MKLSATQPKNPCKICGDGPCQITTNPQHTKQILRWALRLNTWGARFQAHHQAGHRLRAELWLKFMACVLWLYPPARPGFELNVAMREAFQTGLVHDVPEDEEMSEAYREIMAGIIAAAQEQFPGANVKARIIRL